MQAVTTIGLDIAKSVFQVHGVNAEGKVVLRRQLRRGAGWGMAPYRLSPPAGFTAEPARRPNVLCAAAKPATANSPSGSRSTRECCANSAG